MSFTFVGLTSDEVAALPTSTFAHLSASQLSRLSAAQAGVLSGAQIDAIDASAFPGFRSAALAALTVTALAAISPTTVKRLTGAQIAAIAPEALAAMPLANFVVLSASEAAGLTAAQIDVLSGAEIGAFRPASLLGLTDAALEALSADQSAALTAPQVALFKSRQLNDLNVAALNGAPLSTLSKGQLVALSAATIGKFSVSQFDIVLAPHLVWLTAAQTAGLTLDQIASLTPAEIEPLSAKWFGRLTAAQFAALSASTISTLTAAQLVDLKAPTINGLTQTQLDALNVVGLPSSVIAGLSDATLDAFSPSQLGLFSKAQAQKLTTAQISDLTLTNLDALNPLFFGAAQVAGLTADYVSGLSLSLFDQAIAPWVGDLNLSAAQALSTAQIASLTPAEMKAITPAQYASMDSAQQKAVMQQGPLVAEALSLAINGQLSYSGMLQVLETAAKGGMTVEKYDELKYLDTKFAAGRGIGTSAYVTQIADDVIIGDSANSTWNGGSSTATALGDLTAHSTQAQVEELIGTWFLGTNLPSLALPDGTGYIYADQYQAENMPLFGASGPSYLDINQGDVGDCYFLSALGETADLDPSLIENMISENANGTYSVRFNVGGQADYVTVNDELPVMLNDQMANGSTLQFDNSKTLWSPLIEKAYAELMAQDGVEVGASLDTHENSYAATSGGWGNGITAITGESFSTYYASPSEDGSIANVVESALNSDTDVLAFSQDRASGNFVDDHMFMVLQVNAAKGSVLLDNPWNGTGLDSGLQMQFWEPLSSIAAVDGGFYVAHK